MMTKGGPSVSATDNTAMEEAVPSQRNTTFLLLAQQDVSRSGMTQVYTKELDISPLGLNFLHMVAWLVGDLPGGMRTAS